MRCIKMKKDIVNIIFGDSIAYGLYDYELSGWVNQLRNKDEVMKNSVYFNLSIPGQNSLMISNRFEQEFLSRYNNDDEFNLIFAFGIKDALLLNDNPDHLEVFKENVIFLINTAKKYTKNIYFLGLLDVDLDIRNMYQKTNIEIIDQTLKTLCQQDQVKFISMKNIVELTELTDGLHPNSLGHQKIANYIYETIFNKDN